MICKWEQKNEKRLNDFRYMCFIAYYADSKCVCADPFLFFAVSEQVYLDNFIFFLQDAENSGAV